MFFIILKLSFVFLRIQRHSLLKSVALDQSELMSFYCSVSLRGFFVVPQTSNKRSLVILNNLALHAKQATGQ